MFTVMINVIVQTKQLSKCFEPLLKLGGGGGGGGEVGSVNHV